MPKKTAEEVSGLSISRRLELMRRAARISTRTAFRSLLRLEISKDAFDQYFYDRGVGGALENLPEPLRLWAKRNFGTDRDDLLTVNCDTDEEFLRILRGTIFPYGDYLQELDNTPLINLPDDFYEAPLEQISGYVEGRLSVEKASSYPRIIVAPPYTGKRLFLQEWLLKRDNRPSMPVCHFDASRYPDVAALAERIAGVIDPNGNSDLTALDRIRHSMKKYRILVLIENYGTYFETMNGTRRSFHPVLERLFYNLYQDGQHPARLVVTSDDILHQYPLWTDIDCVVRLPKIGREQILSEIIVDGEDQAEKIAQAKRLFNTAASAGLGPLGATRRILLHNELRSVDPSFPELPDDSGLVATVSLMSPFLRTFTRILATSEDGMWRATLIDIISSFFGNAKSEVEPLVDRALKQLAPLLVRRLEKTVKGDDDPCFLIDTEEDRRSILSAWESSKVEADRRDCRKAHRLVGISALSQGDQLKISKRKFDAIGRWVQAARHFLASADVIGPDQSFDKASIAGRIVAVDRRVSAKETIYFVFHDIFIHRLEDDVIRAGKGSRESGHKHRMTRRYGLEDTKLDLLLRFFHPGYSRAEAESPILSQSARLPQPIQLHLDLADSTRLLVDLAVTALRLGKYGIAEDALAEVIDNPLYSNQDIRLRRQAWKTRIDVLTTRGRLDAAETVAREALHQLVGWREGEVYQPPVTTESVEIDSASSQPPGRAELKLIQETRAAIDLFLRLAEVVAMRGRIREAERKLGQAETLAAALAGMGKSLTEEFHDRKFDPLAGSNGRRIVAIKILLGTQRHEHMMPALADAVRHVRRCRDHARERKHDNDKVALLLDKARLVRLGAYDLDVDVAKIEELLERVDRKARNFAMSPLLWTQYLCERAKFLIWRSLTPSPGSDAHGSEARVFAEKLVAAARFSGLDPMLAQGLLLMAETSRGNRDGYLREFEDVIERCSLHCWEYVRSVIVLGESAVKRAAW
jgi:hypothetical protein